MIIQLTTVGTIGRDWTGLVACVSDAWCFGRIHRRQCAIFALARTTLAATDRDGI